MVQKHIVEQVELLLEHLKQGSPDPDFVENHALTILALANDMDFYRTSTPRRQDPIVWLKAS